LGGIVKFQLLYEGGSLLFARYHSISSLGELRMTHTLRLYFGVFALAVLPGCGSGRDPCEPDLFEPNDSFELGADLGSFSDQDTETNLELTLDSPEDRDVFFFDVLDQGIDGNPDVELTLEPDEDDIVFATIELICAGQPMAEFDCIDGDEVEGTHGGQACLFGGEGRLHFSATYDCGDDPFDDTDDSLAIVTIERVTPQLECLAYDLLIEVD
jgi:hypothetical protein